MLYGTVYRLYDQGTIADAEVCVRYHSNLLSCAVNYGGLRDLPLFQDEWMLQGIPVLCRGTKHVFFEMNKTVGSGACPFFGGTFDDAVLWP